MPPGGGANCKLPEGGLGSKLKTLACLLLCLRSVSRAQMQVEGQSGSLLCCHVSNHSIQSRPAGVVQA